jgi:hypothetical protein
MKPSPFGAIKQAGPELNDQITAFFASGKKIDYRQIGETAIPPIQTRREQNDENWKRSRVEITIGKRAQ